MTLKSDSWPAAVAIIVVGAILGMAAGRALGRPAHAPEELLQPARADAAKN